MGIHKGGLFIVSGPSGVGKTTIISEFINKYKSECHIERAITYTTKKPRSSEKDGVDYHFISKSDFEAKIKQGFFIEWSSDYNNMYGTPRSVIDLVDSGKKIIVVIDRNGAEQILKQYDQAVLICITVKNVDIFRDRLVVRGEENQNQITQRIDQSIKELQEEQKSPLYHFFIDNSCLIRSVRGIRDIICPEI